MITFNTRIPISIYPIFFIVVLVLGWLVSMSVVGMFIWAVVVTVSVLVHEFGHALTAIAFGQKARIELVAFGGLTHRHGAKLTLWKEFFVVLNGPCAGFLLGVLALNFNRFLGNPETVVGYALNIAIYVNFFWTFLNLMPIYPLDGGHLLSIFLQGLIGFKGIRLSLLISMVFGCILSICFFAIRAFLPGAIILMLAFESFRAWKSTAVMSEKDQDDHFQTMLKKAQEFILEGNSQEAITLLQKIREEVEKGFIYITATEYLAKIYDNFEKQALAFELMQEIKSIASPDGKRLMHTLAYRLKKYPLVIEMGNEVFQDYPSYRVAEINALAHAAQSEVNPSIGWLQRAIKEGKANIEETLQKEEFNPIRDNPSLLSWVRKHLPDEPMNSGRL